MEMYSRGGGSASSYRPNMGSAPTTRRDTSPFPGLSSRGGYPGQVSQHHHLHEFSPSGSSNTTNPTRNGNFSTVNGISTLSNPTHIRNIDMDSGATVSTRALNKMIDDAIGPGADVGPKPAPEMMINKVIGIPSPVASADRDDAFSRNQRFLVPRPYMQSNDLRKKGSHPFSASSKLRSLSTPKRIEYSHDEMSQVYSILTRETGAYSRFRDMSEPRGRYPVTRDNCPRNENGDRISVPGEYSAAGNYRVRDQSPSQAWNNFSDRSRHMKYPTFSGRRESALGGKYGERGIAMTGSPPQFSKSLYLREKERYSRDQDSGIVDHRSDRLYDKRYNTMDHNGNLGREDHDDRRHNPRSRNYEMGCTADPHREGQQYEIDYARVDQDRVEMQGKQSEPAAATSVFRSSTMVQNVPRVIQQRKIVPVPSELTTLIQDANDRMDQEQMIDHIVIPRDLSDQTLSSKWKDDDTVELPKGQVSAEAAIAATAAASLIADPSNNEFDIDKAAQALSSIANPSSEGASIVMKSSVTDESETNNSVVTISYNAVKKNVEQSMTVASPEANQPQGIAPMTAFEFWTRCALAVSTAIMEKGTNPIHLAHKAAEAVMTHGTAKMKSDWLSTAEKDLKDVTTAVLDAISTFPGGRGEAMETLISTAILNEGCKAIAMESLIIPALLSKIQ